MTGSTRPLLGRRGALALLAALPAAACSGATQNPAGTPTGSSAATTPSHTRTPTPAPTPTRSPRPTPRHARTHKARPSPRPSPSPSPRTPPKPRARGSASVHRTLVTGLHSPWGLVFLPDGSAVLGNRDEGSLLHITPNGSTRTLGHVPDVYHEGEGGLLGLATAPSFTRDRQLFIFHSTNGDNRVVRGRLGKHGLSAVKPILTGIPRGFYHNGGGLCFDRAGHLFVSTGEGGDPARAQDKGSLGGKILRITRDGDPAPGNPFGDNPVYSYGHRNVEAIAFNGDRLWAVEFGDHAYDELNPIVAGANYGWPQTQGRTDQPGITSPAAQWPTETAGPAGIAIRDSVAWIACVTGERLYRVPLQGRSAGTSQTFFQGRFGRLRRVVTAPAGRLWLVTSNTDGRGTVRPGDDRILVLDAR